MSPVYRPSTTAMRVATERSAPIIAAIGSTTSCPDADSDHDLVALLPVLGDQRLRLRVDERLDRLVQRLRHHPAHLRHVPARAQGR